VTFRREIIKNKTKNLLIECSSGKIKQLSSGANSAIEVKRTGTTSDNTHTILSRNYPARCHYFFYPNRNFDAQWAIFGLCHYCIPWAN